MAASTRGHAEPRARGWWGGVFALSAVVSAGCASPMVLRAPRVGAQRDPQGRVFYELRRVTAIGCHDPARGAATTEEMSTRLAGSAQAQGYSGVVDVQCAPMSLNGCARGVSCSALAVRYVVPDSSGAGARDPRVGVACSPPCEGSASCQEGQCVAACEPPCAGGEVCGPAGRCEPVSALGPAPIASAAPSAGR